MILLHVLLRKVRDCDKHLDNKNVVIIFVQGINIFIMKRIHLLLIVSFLILISCCSRDWIGRGTMGRDFVPDFTTTIVTPEEAKSAVLSMLEDVDGGETKGSSGRSISDIWLAGDLSTKSDAEDAPLFYVINFADDKGFAIAGADRRVPPVVFIADEGSLNRGDTLKNPGLIIMLSKIETESRMLLGLPVEGANGRVWTAEEYRPYMDLGLDRGIGYDPDSCDIYWTLQQTYTPVGTQVGCHWNQVRPFNAYCPKINGDTTLVGCVPVAVGQIMYYHGKDYTYNNTYYNWNLMHLITSGSAPSQYPYSSAWYKVKKLLVDLGDSTNLAANYGVEGTFAEYNNCIRTFQHFGYQSGGSFNRYEYSTLASEIASGYPVISTGSRDKIIHTLLGIPVDTVRVGHAWVSDQTMNSLWRVWVVHKRTQELVYSTMVYRNMIHCNWGWGGYHDGYCLEGIFDADNTYSPTTKTYDDSIIVSRRFYNQRLKMVSGIRP